MPTTRLDKLRQQLQAQQIDCLALVPGFNLRYLTGLDFHLSERAFIALIPADASAQPVLMMPLLEISKWEEKPPFAAQLFGWEDTQGPPDAMRQAIMALPEVHTLAVEHLGMRVQEQNLLLRHLPNVTVSDAESLLDPLRMRKDGAEIAATRSAIEISEAALEEVITTVNPGDTERQIANRLTLTMLNGGAHGLAFESLVQSGPRSALPHGASNERAVQAGELLLIDFGAMVDGYQADITRTFVVGRQPDAQIRAMYDAVLAANAAGRALCRTNDAARPGITCHDVDRATRKAIEDAGFGQYFIHRTGHGLGLDTHEAPSIMSDNHMPLAAGMLFTIEPGVYIEDVGGVRIEDNVLITTDGAQSLTTFDRKLRIIGV